jgi:transcriptional regulator with XRE-family HTH domain
MKEIQQMLRELRKYHNKTLADVSAGSGLSISYLSDLERGTATPFDAAMATLNKILAVYDLKAALKLEPIKGKEKV